MADVPNPSAPASPQPRKRGRKKKAGTLVVNVRITREVYDRYCLVALRMRPGPIAVRSVLRHILTLHAPSVDVQ